VQLNSTPENNLWTVYVDNTKYAVETPEFKFYRRRLKLNIDGQVHRFRLQVEKSFLVIAFSGITRLFEIYTPKEWNLLKHMPEKIEKLADNVLVCPMPGLVVEVPIKKGERVFRGQALVIIESMKMESGVASPVDGIVAEVRVSAGKAVEAGDILVRFKD
jgi:propionyl-CoA carboxylase alpha chain